MELRARTLSLKRQDIQNRRLHSESTQSAKEDAQSDLHPQGLQKRFELPSLFVSVNLERRKIPKYKNKVLLEFEDRAIVEVDILRNLQQLQKLAESETERSINAVKALFVELCRCLKKHNPLLRRLSQGLILKLLQISRIIKLNYDQYLYIKGDVNDSFYILISGEVLLLDKAQKFKKTSVPGDVLSQDVLYRNNPIFKKLMGSWLSRRPLRLENCKCKKDCTYALEIALQLFDKLKGQNWPGDLKDEMRFLDSLMVMQFYNKFSVRKAALTD